MEPQDQEKHELGKNAALFLDRDGVINIDYGHVHTIQDFHFIEGIFDLARLAHHYSYKILVITNQSGIARGLYTEKQFNELTEWMCDQFSIRGAIISKVYFSPYHPTEGFGSFRKDHISRKPNPGMILQAQSEFDLNLKKSIFIGDNMSDIQAGTSAGVGTNVLFGKSGCKGPLRPKFTVVKTIANASKLLINQSPSSVVKGGVKNSPDT